MSLHIHTKRNLYLELFASNPEQHYYQGILDRIKNFQGTREEIFALEDDYNQIAKEPETPQIAQVKIGIVKCFSDQLKLTQSDQYLSRVLVILDKLARERSSETQATSVFHILDAFYAIGYKLEEVPLRELIEGYIMLMGGEVDQEASGKELMLQIARIPHQNNNEFNYSESHLKALHNLEVYLFWQLSQYTSIPPNLLDVCMASGKSLKLFFDLIKVGVPLPQDFGKLLYLFRSYLTYFPQDLLFFCGRLFDLNPEIALAILDTINEQTEESYFEILLRIFPDRSELTKFLISKLDLLTQNHMGALIDQPEQKIRYVGFLLLEKNPRSDLAQSQLNSMIERGRFFEIVQLLQRGKATIEHREDESVNWLQSAAEAHEFSDLLPEFEDECDLTNFPFLTRYMKNEYDHEQKIPKSHKELMSLFKAPLSIMLDFEKRLALLRIMVIELPRAYRPLIQEVLEQYVSSSLQEKAWARVQKILIEFETIINPKSLGLIAPFGMVIERLNTDEDFGSYLTLWDLSKVPNLAETYRGKPLITHLLARVALERTGNWQAMLACCMPTFAQKLDRELLFVESCKAGLRGLVREQLRLIQDEPQIYERWVVFSYAFNCLDQDLAQYFQVEKITNEHLEPYFVEDQDPAINLALEKLYLPFVPQLNVRGIWEISNLAESFGLNKLQEALFSRKIATIYEAHCTFNKRDPLYKPFKAFLEELFDYKFSLTANHFWDIISAVQQMDQGTKSQFQHSRLLPFFNLQTAEQFQLALNQKVKNGDFNKEDPKLGKFADMVRRLPEMIRKECAQIAAGFTRDSYVHNALHKSAVFSAMACLSAEFVDYYFATWSEHDWLASHIRTSQGKKWLQNIVSKTASRDLELLLSEKLLEIGFLDLIEGE